MKIAYLDSSFLIAMLLGEKNSEKLHKKFSSFERVITCGLLEAEVLSTLKRENLIFELATPVLEQIDWVFPDQSMQNYLKKILQKSYLRGADAYHLAAALWTFRELTNSCTFLSLDKDQLSAAKSEGFVT